MPNITFLHVSDLHFQAGTEFDRKIVIDALFNDIRKLRSEGASFDAVLFTGDLVMAGAVKENFGQAFPKFIDPLLEAASVPRERLFLCPGNHDVSKDAVIGYIDSGLKAALTSVEEINKFIDVNLLLPDMDHAKKATFARMDNYEDFYKSLGLGAHISDNVFFKTRLTSIGGLKVGVASLNSAWRSTGNTSDRQHLIIGERAVDRAIGDLASADLRVCLFHHPLEWLLEPDSQAIENRIYDAFDLICFGHMHQPSPRYRTSPLGSALVSQSGSVYASRKWFNGYQVITWDEVNRKVLLQCQTYFDQPRREFAPAENLTPKGKYEFNLTPRKNGEALTEIELFLRQGRKIVRIAADAQINFTRAKGDKRKDDVTEAYVCPPLSIHLESETLIKPETEFERQQRRIDADALLRQTSDFLVAGAGESGRTSLLHFLSVRVSEGVSDKARIPAVLNMPLLSKSTYEKALKSFYADAEIAPAAMNHAVKKLSWFVLLDDFDGSKPEHINLLKEIRTEYPDHRLAIVSKGSHRKKCREILGDSLMAIDMEFLPRKSIRQLSRARFSGKLETGMDDPAYQLVMKHLNEARLPRTGYMVALLLWAAEQNRLGETLNEAILLENLISFLLGKTNFDAALRNQFDPRAQEFLLQAIAVELRKAGGWLASNDLLEFILDYFKSRGLRHGAREVLDEFIACRLLVEQDEHIGFSYPCYQEYFVALNLRQDQKKLAALLEGADANELLSYSRELDLWSSLSREFHGTDEALLKLLKGEGLDSEAALNDLGTLTFSGTQLAFSRKRVKELLDNAPTKDQIDEILDKADEARTISTRKTPGEIQDDEKERTEKEHEKLEDENSTKMREAIFQLGMQRSALKTFTRLVRNADHERLDKKKQITAVLLKLWSAHTLAYVAFINDLIAGVIAKETQGKTEEEIKLTPEDMDRISNIFRVMLSWIDGAGVAGLLTSESLRSPFKELAEDKSQPEGIRFFAGLAYAETWDKAGISLMSDLLKTLKNPVLKHAALQKMLSDYRMQRYRTAQVEGFRELIFETEMVVLGTNMSQKGERIRSLVQQEEQDK